MATVRLSDVIVPSAFTDYIVQNTMQLTAFFASGVARRNAAIEDQLRAGSESFTVPFWLDLDASIEPNYSNDDPDDLSSPKKLGAGKQRVRKAYLNESWSAMNLASELAGSNALGRIQDRVTAFWDRQMQARIIASLVGVKADNVANDGGDMVHDISGASGDAANFSAEAVIDATATMGDAMNSVTAIAMHSDIYARALKNDLIDSIPDSQGGFIRTFRGMVAIVDDGLPVASGNYTSVLFGSGAVGYGITAPTSAEGTEIESQPSAGAGGGMTVLHSRVNVAAHPFGFDYIEGTITEFSPTLADLRLAAHWNRVAAERKQVPLAFLVSK